MSCYNTKLPEIFQFNFNGNKSLKRIEKKKSTSTSMTVVLTFLIILNSFAHPEISKESKSSNPKKVKFKIWIYSSLLYQEKKFQRI